MTEGNELLLDGPFAPVRPMLTECWYVEVEPGVRLERLVARRERHGRAPDAARRGSPRPTSPTPGSSRPPATGPAWWYGSTDGASPRPSSSVASGASRRSPTGSCCSPAVFLLFVVIGAASSLDIVIGFCDVVIIAMSSPHVIGVSPLMRVVKREPTEHEDDLHTGVVSKVDV